MHFSLSFAVFDALSLSAWYSELREIFEETMRANCFDVCRRKFSRFWMALIAREFGKSSRDGGECTYRSSKPFLERLRKFHSETFERNYMEIKLTNLSIKINFICPSTLVCHFNLLKCKII